MGCCQFEDSATTKSDAKKRKGTPKTESIEDLVARRELSAVVEEAMALLPEEQRTAIVLKEYHGMTFQEIATLQGCPLSTVKTRLYQGLTVLRRLLEKEGRTPQLVKRI